MTDDCKYLFKSFDQHNLSRQAQQSWTQARRFKERSTELWNAFQRLQKISFEMSEDDDIMICKLMSENSRF